jgi:hypothetical protein
MKISSCPAAESLWARHRLLRRLALNYLERRASPGSTTDRWPAFPPSGKSYTGMGFFSCTGISFVARTIKLPLPGAGVKGLDHKMLWVVTRSAPSIRGPIQERFTIHTFSTSFPQTELPGSGRGLRISACKVEKDGWMRQILAASRRAVSSSQRTLKRRSYEVLDREPVGRQTSSPGRQPWDQRPHFFKSPARGGRIQGSQAGRSAAAAGLLRGMGCSSPGLMPWARSLTPSGLW